MKITSKTTTTKSITNNKIKPVIKEIIELPVIMNEVIENVVEQLIELPVIIEEVPLIKEIIELPVIIEEVPLIKEIIELPVNNFVDNLVKQIEETTQINNVVINQNVVVTKASLARGIFEEELLNGLSRKNTINRLILEANLTKAGASTYFQNMKKKAGLVVSRV